jgi:putative ABC transport system permease protein
MTSCFISHIKINQVLASVITLSVLKTFILKLASVGNNVGVKELAGKSIMSPAASSAVLAVVVVATVCIFLVKILRSEYGLAMRVYGNGEVISESLGINTNGILLIGLGIGNMLAALAGALIAQIAGTFSVNMGDGSLIFGLAAVIIGEKIIAPSNVFAAISGCFVGSLAYKLIMETANLGGASDLGSEYNNLIMGVVLVLLIAIIQNRGKGVPA